MVAHMGLKLGWWVELGPTYGRSSWTGFFIFFGGGGGDGTSCYDSSYLGEFLCFPEVLGIATKFRFRESWVIMKTR